MRRLAVGCAVSILLFSGDGQANKRLKYRHFLSKRLPILGKVAGRWIDPTVQGGKDTVLRMTAFWAEVGKKVGRSSADKAMFGLLVRSIAKKDIVFATGFSSDLALEIGSVFEQTGIRPPREVANHIQRVLENKADDAIKRIDDNPMEAAALMGKVIELGSAIKGVEVPLALIDTKPMRKIVKTLKSGIRKGTIQHSVNLSMRGMTNIFNVTALVHYMQQLASVAPKGNEVLQKLNKVLNAE